MLKTDKMKDFWVVMDEKTGRPPVDRLCAGFDNEQEAITDAQSRTAKAKAEFGKDWKYKVVPNPTL